jgi:hypothetical protein
MPYGLIILQLGYEKLFILDIHYNKYRWIYVQDFLIKICKLLILCLVDNINCLGNFFDFARDDVGI